MIVFQNSAYQISSFFILRIPNVLLLIPVFLCKYEFFFHLYVAHDIDRNRKAIDGSMSDGRKRQEEEIKLLKEKFQRARNILEEQEEFSRRKESLKFMNDLDNVRNEVEKQRRELNENHQRILSRTVRNNSEKKLKFEKQMNDENISWENNFRSQILKDQVMKIILYFKMMILYLNIR